MTDIVERLRDKWVLAALPVIARDAADEIESLRQQLEVDKAFYENVEGTHSQALKLMQISLRQQLDSLNKARAQRDELLKAAVAVVDRWDSPSWKDVPHTGEFIHRLRAAITNTTKGQP